jgi:hypothetical protein
MANDPWLLGPILVRTLGSQDTTRAALLIRFMVGPQRLEERLQNVPPPAWSFRLGLDDWTINDVVVHIADNEAVGFVRIRMALAERGGDMPGYDEVTWARELHYVDEDVDEALQAFRVLRSRTYSLLNRLPESAWDPALDGAQGRGLTVDDRLRGEVEHDELHLRQIEQLHASWEVSVGA